MTELSLIKTRIQAGIWEGILTGAAPDGGVPDLRVTHLGKVLNTVAVSPDPDTQGQWAVKIAIPPNGHSAWAIRPNGGTAITTCKLLIT